MRLSPSERVIAWRLSEGRCVSTDELIGALWGDREDGGPLCAYHTIAAHIHRIRAALENFGIDIRVRYAFGWSVSADHIAELKSVLADEISRNVRNRKSASVSQTTALTPKGMDEVHAAA